MNMISKQNTNGANRAQQQRPQMQSGPARGTKPNIEIYRPPSITLMSFNEGECAQTYLRFRFA